MHAVDRGLCKCPVPGQQHFTRTPHFLVLLVRLSSPIPQPQPTQICLPKSSQALTTQLKLPYGANHADIKVVGIGYGMYQCSSESELWGKISFRMVAAAMTLEVRVEGELECAGHGSQTATVQAAL